MLPETTPTDTPLTPVPPPEAAAIGQLILTPGDARGWAQVYGVCFSDTYDGSGAPALSYMVRWSISPDSPRETWPTARGDYLFAVVL